METREAIRNQETDYAAAIDAITSRPLVPETIDTYAENALQDLIDVVRDVEADYVSNPTFRHESARETETAAFEYFGLGSVEEKLDHIADKAAELHEIDRIIEAAPKVREVIIPTDDTSPNISEGNGEKFEPKQLIPRTKTVLFVLANAFDVDLKDPEQFSMKSGEVLPNMVRKTSYNIIETPGISRTMLVCDEEDNVSYVFDNTYFEKLDIKSSDLVGLTKSELNGYLKSYPGLGERIVYSEKFVTKITQALTEISNTTDSTSHRIEKNLNFLDPAQKAPKAPEGYLSMSGVGRLLGVSTPVIENILSTIVPEEMGTIPQLKFGPNTTQGFSPSQQEIIRANLEAKGFIPGELADGFLKARSFAIQLGISRKTVTDMIKSVGVEEFGELEKSRFHGKLSYILSPAQQTILLSRLEAKGLLAPQAPEGYLALKGISQALGLDRSTIERVVKAIGTEVLGNPEKMKFNGTQGNAFSPAQQEIITQKLRQDGYLDLPIADNGDENNNFVPPAPEDHLSVNLLRKQLGVSQTPIQAVIQSIDPEEMGKVDQFKFGNTRAEGYSPAQQALIIQKLEERGTFAAAPPEGYISMATLSRKLTVAAPSLQKAIDLIDPEKFGQIGRYKFITKTVPGLSPVQQEMVSAKLYEEGLLAPVAPEGYLSRAGISKLFNGNTDRIIKALDAEGSLGEVNYYRFEGAPRPYRGYSLEQQSLIEAQLGKL